jgi:hypothetical protein
VKIIEVKAIEKVISRQKGIPISRKVEHLIAFAELFFDSKNN